MSVAASSAKRERFRKRIVFTPEKEESTFSKRRKSKSINKELFPVKFVCFSVSLFKRRKDSALVVKFYNTAVRLLEYLQGKVCDGDHR